MNQISIQEVARPIEASPEVSVDDSAAEGACDPVEVVQAFQTNPLLDATSGLPTIVFGETIRLGGNGGRAQPVLNGCAGQVLRFRCGAIIDAVTTEGCRYGGSGGTEQVTCRIPDHGCIRLTRIDTSVCKGFTVLSYLQFECDGVPVKVCGSTTEGKRIFFSAPGLWVRADAFHSGKFLDAISFRTVLQGPCPGASLWDLSILRLGGCGGGLVVRTDGCAGQHLRFYSGSIIDAIYAGTTRYGGGGGSLGASCLIPDDGRIRLLCAETAVLKGFTVLSRLQFEANGQVVDVRGSTGGASQVFHCEAGLWVRIEALYVGAYLDAITFRVL